MSHDVLKFFSNYIERETGIVYQDSNMYQLKSRLEDIAKQKGFQTLEELKLAFEKSPSLALKTQLLDQATNNETLFFRDKVFFDSVIQYIKDTKPNIHSQPIRIWSAACSSGQEPLSIAMSLEEAFNGQAKYNIIATDISSAILEKAKAGIYSEFEVMRGLPPELRNKYFSSEGKGWKAKDILMSKITYHQLNLLRPEMGIQCFDLIFCRNVLIYQNLERKQKIVESLLRYQDDNGVLVLGVGETLIGIVPNVEMVKINNTILYKKMKLKTKVA